MADRPARLVTRPVRLAVDATIWTVLGGGTLLLGLQLAGGHVGRLVTVAQTFTPWAVPVLVAAAVVALSLRSYGAALAGGVLVFGYLAVVAPLAFPRALPDPVGDGRLRVLHANLLYSNPRIDEAIAVMADADPDVIAVSELTPEFAEAIETSAIGRRYPYASVRPGNAAIGLGIWSKLPLLDTPTVPDTTMTTAVTVALDRHPVQLVLTHPLPPVFGRDRWRREIAALTAAAADGAWSSTVLVGDLNVSYYHPPYRRFVAATDTTDVQQAMGDGFSFSWPTDEWFPPFVRLDHALVGRDVTATDVRDVELPGADHHAFVVTIAWAEPAADGS